MPVDRDRVRVELEASGRGNEATARASDAAAPKIHQGTHHIALLGDFSGRANQGRVERGRELASRRPLRVDRDSLDDAMARLDPALELAELGIPEVRFSSLDDFHPDQLVARLPTFRALRELKEQAATHQSAPHAAGAPISSQTGVLDAILAELPSPPGGAALARARVRDAGSAVDSSLADVVHRAISPYLVAEPGKNVREAIARIDVAIGDLLRRVLHHPHFQALEALWRGVDLLVRRLDTDHGVRLHLIDLSKEEIADDLTSNAHSSEVRRLFGDPSAGTAGTSWSLVVGLYSFGVTEPDLVLLRRVAAIARQSGAPFIAAAHPSVAGVSSFRSFPDWDDWSPTTASAWDELRREPQAPFVGLALPRILLRLPYGERTDPCELRNFEEFPSDAAPPHEELLWGSGAVAVALVMGDALATEGAMRFAGQINDLPFHVYRTDGEAVATPCAEALLTDASAERLLERGLIPILSVKEQDAIVLPRIQSIAAPASPLVGSWSVSADAEG